MHLLLDGFKAGVHGGSGVSFDWTQAGRSSAAGQSSLPLVLAGGLHPGNVQEAIASVSPYAVDVSSGVESSPGRKDPQKIRAFVDAVRNIY